MRKKLISKTYLRDVEKYTQVLYMDNDDFFVSVKHLIKTEPFVSKDGIALMADGYYLVEVVPRFEHYAMRAFMDSKKRVVEYYFDIWCTDADNSSFRWFLRNAVRLHCRACCSRLRTRPSM